MSSRRFNGFARQFFVWESLAESKGRTFRLYVWQDGTAVYEDRAWRWAIIREVSGRTISKGMELDQTRAERAVGKEWRRFKALLEGGDAKAVAAFEVTSRAVDKAAELAAALENARVLAERKRPGGRPSERAIASVEGRS